VAVVAAVVVPSAFRDSAKRPPAEWVHFDCRSSKGRGRFFEAEKFCIEALCEVTSRRRALRGALLALLCEHFGFSRH
jgi:hypothetical protein